MLTGRGLIILLCLAFCLGVWFGIWQFGKWTVHEIGKYVCDEVKCDPKRADVRLTDHIKEQMMKVKALDDEAGAFEKEISKLTVIKKERLGQASSAHRGGHPPRRKVSSQKG